MDGSNEIDKQDQAKEDTGCCVQGESDGQLEQWGHKGRRHAVCTKGHGRKDSMDCDKGRECKTVPAICSRETTQGHEKRLTSGRKAL